MAKEARVNAVIDPALKKRLYIALIEDDLTFTEWLHRQIILYLQGKKPKHSGKRKPGRGRKG